MKTLKLPVQVFALIACTMFIPTVSASSVYYNASQAYTSNIGTDNNAGQDGIASTPLFDAQDTFTGYQVNTTFTGWNTSSSLLPFGFNNERLNWAVDISASGEALTVSSQDAHDRYGIWGDIDTAKGAWFDGINGWEHQTDVGVIRSSVDTVININITGLENTGANGLWTNFGVSIYSGMPEGQWKMHGGWNCATCTYFPGFEADSPLSDSGMTYITHDGTVDSVNGISFNASAGVVYTILLGGNSGGTHFNPKEGYALSIGTAPVPVPSAFWLFGSALVSLSSVVGKKRKAI
jgi:hypothetical protein